MRVRTRCPPSLRSQTPGTRVAATQFFHLLSHFFFLSMWVAVGRGTRTIRGDRSRGLASEESIEIVPAPHPRPRPTTATDGSDPTFKPGLSQPSVRAEPAVGCCPLRRHERRP